MEKEDGIGLALSGGGFRATLFHLGAVWRLNELSLLLELGRISAVSGGSILAGLMATRWSRLTFSDGKATNFQEEIVDPIWNFCSLNIDVKAILWGVIVGPSTLASYYEKHLVGKSTLQDMPDYPDFVFNAAHVETGRNWSFSKSCMRTWRLGAVDLPSTTIAKVIAASSALPPYFSPMVFKLDPREFRRTPYADLFHRDELKGKVSLVDGGLYDNLGVHSVRHFEAILISDASSPLAAKRGLFWLRFFWHRAKRPVDIAVEQARALRRSEFVGKFISKEKRGAFWAVSTELKKYEVQSPFPIREEWQSHFESISTRLRSFSEEEKSRLVNWGYVQCDLSVRSYFLKTHPLPSSLPFPQCDFASTPGNGR